MVQQLNKPPSKPAAPSNKATTGNTALASINHDAQIRLARSRLNAAFAAQVAGDSQKAKDILADAVRTDPDLINDTSALGLACALYTVERAQAGVILFEQSQQQIDTTRYRPAINFDADARATAIELVIAFLLTTILGGLIYVAIQTAGIDLIGRFLDESRESLRATLATLTINRLILNSVGNSILWLMTLLSGVIFAFIIGTLLGGTGAVSKFVRYMMRPLMLLTAAAGVGIAFNMAGVASVDVARGETLILIGTWTFYIAVLVSILGMAFASAKAHRYGAYKGLATVVFGSLVSIVFVLVFGLLRQG
jgi:hypothetical protein